MTQTIGNPLPNGSVLPHLPELRASQNQKININEIRRENGIVLAFIHGTWCPYCVNQLTRLNKAALELEKRQVGLACISHDPETSITAYQLSANPPLRFPLLADSEPSIAHTFGIFDDYPEHLSPYPAVFYVDKNNIIRFSDISSDPDCQPDLNKLIVAIDAV